MWLVTITVSADAWKIYGTNFKSMTEKYQSAYVSSKKMSDGKRLMEYKIEDVEDAEALTDLCQNFEGFTATFESL